MNNWEKFWILGEHDPQEKESWCYNKVDRIQWVKLNVQKQLPPVFTVTTTVWCTDLHQWRLEALLWIRQLLILRAAALCKYTAFFIIAGSFASISAAQMHSSKNPGHNVRIISKSYGHSHSSDIFFRDVHATHLFSWFRMEHSFSTNLQTSTWVQHFFLINFYY